MYEQLLFLYFTDFWVWQQSANMIVIINILSKQKPDNELMKLLGGVGGKNEVQWMIYLFGLVWLSWIYRHLMVWLLRIWCWFSAATCWTVDNRSPKCSIWSFTFKAWIFTFLWPSVRNLTEWKNLNFKSADQLFNIPQVKACFFILPIGNLEKFWRKPRQM